MSVSDVCSPFVFNESRSEKIGQRKEDTRQKQTTRGGGGGGGGGGGEHEREQASGEQQESDLSGAPSLVPLRNGVFGPSVVSIFRKTNQSNYSFLAKRQLFA